MNVSGVSTLAAVTASSLAASAITSTSTLNVSGNSRLAAVTASSLEATSDLIVAGASYLNGGNNILSGTLNVTGASTLYGGLNVTGLINADVANTKIGFFGTPSLGSQLPITNGRSQLSQLESNTTAASQMTYDLYQALKQLGLVQ